MNIASGGLPEVPLSELATFNRAAPVLAPDVEVAFVPMAAVSELGTMKVADHLRVTDLKPGYNYMQTGDVLVAKITPCFENNKIVIAALDREHGFGSTEFHIIRTNAAALDNRYLLHFLRQDSVRSSGEKRMTGSAGQRRVPRLFLEELPIPLPPLGRQRRIAAILDQADDLRRKRREALGKLNELSGCVLAYTSGDPAGNPKGWRISRLRDVCSSLSDGPHVSPEYVESGIPFLSTRNIRPEGIVWSDLKFISQADAKIQWKKVKPARGDILYTKGGTTGIARAVDFDIDIAVWVHVAVLKLIKSKVDPVWLQEMLNSAYCYRQSQRLTKGIVNRDLGLRRMVDIVFPLPPLDLQQDFATRVAEIDKLKAQHRAHLAKLDALFASLQHRAFRGEL